MKNLVKGGRGLTLVELVAALAVLTIMVTLGIPAFQRLVERARTGAAHHQLTASLMLARTAAISRREPVAMCPSADGVRCRADVAWEQGWIVFPDPGRTGQPETADSVLRQVGPLRGGLLVRSSRGRRLVRYLPTGQASGSNVSLRLCSGSEELLAKVVVNNVGRTRTEHAADGETC